MSSWCYYGYDRYSVYSSGWDSRCMLQPLSETGWNPYVAVVFAFQVIKIAVLVIILVGSILFHKRLFAARNTFRWFIPAITLAILAFTDQAIDRILGEEQHTVGTGYRISTAILWYLQYLADVLLLAAIFTYIIPRVASARQSTGSTRTYSAPLFLHILLCGLLVILWLVMTIVGIIEVARQALGLDKEDPHSRRITVFVFDTLYLFAALEILGLAVIAIVLSRRGNDRTSNKSHLPLVFCTLVSVPLFVRQTWEFAFGIAYRLTTGADLELILPVLLAHQIFATLCTISVYAGLALVMRGRKRDTVAPYADVYVDDSPADSGRRVGKGNLGPEIPIMRLAAPTEDQEPFDPHAPHNQSRGDGVSREHSQGPIYNAP